MMQTNHRTETLIIGGGLSGLALADQLAQADHDFLMVEARSRLGGRVHSISERGARFDMGPTWFWPGQPRMSALAERMNAPVFAQYSTGDARVELANGDLHQAPGYGSMQGSLRVSGGMMTLIDGLARGLPADQMRIDTHIISLTRDAQGITAQTRQGEVIRAARVVLCLPPRLAAEISCTPALPEGVTAALRGIPTWMAGHAKALIIYADPFWRDRGLSGDAVSQRGPLVEIHDASTSDGTPAALFGFLGIGPEDRQDRQALTGQITAQISRLFGPDAPAPEQVVLTDWAFEPLTATPADHAPLRAHPAYGMPPALTGVWDGTLIFSGTELAPQTGGFLEGALEAADAASRLILAPGS